MSKRNITGWLRDNRSSTRVAFLMQLGVRVASGLVGLVWTRLIVDAIGAALFQSYLIFQGIVTLGGLGDLGMGGVVGIRTGQYLGQGKFDELRKFLGSARSAFLLLGLVAGAVLMLASPWMPAWLRFKPVPGSGSLTLLFCLGGLLVAGVVFSSYLNNLNYACGNVTWPIIPGFLLLQLGVCCHWLLARQHFPLWIQCLPYVAQAAVGMLLVGYYIRLSHPALAEWRPVHADWPLVGSLLEGSFWVYLCALGNAVYQRTDALVINAGAAFPAGTYTSYNSNYRACDLTVSVAITASYVAMPKITRWLASSDAADRARAHVETHRLNQFQILLGFVAALGYLACNSLFITLWWWHKGKEVAPAPLLLQLAFALNMAVVTSGAAGLEIAIRSDRRGLRLSGALVALMALLNVSLALIAMHAGSLVGIAMATVVAQSLQNLISSAYACRRLGVRWLPWAGRAWLLPVAGILIAAWMRALLPLYTPEHGLFLVNILVLATAYAAMILGAAALLGIRPAFIREELAIVRGFLKR